jgi:hypothetical protein
MPLAGRGTRWAELRKLKAMRPTRQAGSHTCRRKDKFQSVYIYSSQCIKNGRIASVSTAQIRSTSLDGRASSSVNGTDGGAEEERWVINNLDCCWLARRVQTCGAVHAADISEAKRAA